jgi:hypothetical protein
MATFETYQEVRHEYSGNKNELELLQANSLQRAWAESHVALLEGVTEAEREEAMVQWMVTVADWFRHHILEYPAEPGKEDRKKHFLEGFDTHPEETIAELDALFKASQH